MGHTLRRQCKSNHRSGEAMQTQHRGKDISGCGISGIVAGDGELFSAELFTHSIANMRERADGLVRL